MTTNVVLITVFASPIERYNYAQIFSDGISVPKDLKNLLYTVPVYEAYLRKVTTNGRMPPDSNPPIAIGEVYYRWKALRFMPYLKVDNTIGISGLTYHPVKNFNEYKKNWYGGGMHFDVNADILKQNPGLGNNFHFHEGPKILSYSGVAWGAIGCIEIVGDYDKFLENLLSLLSFKISGKTMRDEKMIAVIKDGKVWLELLYDNPYKRDIKIVPKRK